MNMMIQLMHVNDVTVPEQLVSIASQICEMRGSPSFILHTALIKHCVHSK